MSIYSTNILSNRWSVYKRRTQLFHITIYFFIFTGLNHYPAQLGLFDKGRAMISSLRIYSTALPQIIFNRSLRCNYVNNSGCKKKSVIEAFLTDLWKCDCTKIKDMRFRMNCIKILSCQEACVSFKKPSFYLTLNSAHPFKVPPIS